MSTTDGWDVPSVPRVQREPLSSTPLSDEGIIEAMAGVSAAGSPVATDSSPLTSDPTGRDDTTGRVLFIVLAVLSVLLFAGGLAYQFL